MHPPFRNEYHLPRFSITVCPDLSAICQKVAFLLMTHIASYPSRESCLCLSTGSSPEGVYRELIRYYHCGELDFANVHAMNLDEYVGLDESDPQSYAFYMRDKLFDHVNIDPIHTDIPDGKAADLDRECLRYDSALDVEHIDIALLGLGRNGHIAFNEPGDTFCADTHVVDLDESTVEANSRFFAPGEFQPTRAITMGMRGILKADRIFLIAAGEEKADALHSMVVGPIDPRCPASILQLHRQVHVFADDAALSRFTDAERRDFHI